MAQPADKGALALYPETTLRSFAREDPQCRARYSKADAAIEAMTRGQLEGLITSVYFSAAALQKHFFSKHPIPVVARHTPDPVAPPLTAPIGSRADRAAALKGQGPLAVIGPRYAKKGSRADRAMALAGMVRPKDAPQ